VAIYARNCAQWLITALACVRQSMVVVPLYDTLGSDSAAYIVRHTDAE
jgi:long-chain acyl-CoA synthetase